MQPEPESAAGVRRAILAARATQGATMMPRRLFDGKGEAGQAPARTSSTRGEPGAGPAKPLHLMVVDDHGIVRRGIRTLLETHPGWEVVGEAADGEEAVTEAKRLKPDVIVMDVSMPRVSGYEATRRIMAAVPETRVLILSMHESEQAVCEMLDAGARGYVFKSDLDRDLMMAVELLGQNKYFFAPKVSEMLVSDCLTSCSASAKPRMAPAALTARQRQVTRLLAGGKTNKEVAVALNISVKTAETHRTNIMRKLQLHSFSELVRYAVRQKLIEL